MSFTFARLSPLHRCDAQSGWPNKSLPSWIAGTLTKAVINFAKMRQRANILEGDILEVLGTLPVQERVRVEAIINEVEDEVCQNSIYKLPDHRAVIEEKRKSRSLPCLCRPCPRCRSMMAWLTFASSLTRHRSPGTQAYKDAAAL